MDFLLKVEKICRNSGKTAGTEWFPALLEDECLDKGGRN
jgi:hypothetical protein